MQTRNIRALLFGIVFLCAAPLVFSGDTWIDVRSPAEYAEENIGHINIAHGQIVKEIGKYVKDKDASIKLYCRSGNRAGKAKAALEAEGYTNVSNEGGLSEVKAKMKEEKHSNASPKPEDGNK